MTNADDENESEGNEEKNEDLRVGETESPLLLVEVKGVSGTPGDDDALQVAKHIVPRMRDLNRTDVLGLGIINHQRHVPALDRERDPFRDIVVTTAKKQSVGLLTTWDFYRLARSFLRNGWAHQQVRNLFYRSGRISPVPSHYQLVGIVEKFWERVGAVGVRLSEGELRLHARVAFELPWEYLEQNVESLQVDRNAVYQVRGGDLAGIKTGLTKQELREGTRVYCVAVATLDDQSKRESGM